MKLLQIGSDSQFNHCHRGNCLDEVMNHVDVYYKQAREMIQMNDLMNVFDEVCRMIGARKVSANTLLNVLLFGSVMIMLLTK